MIKLLFTAPGWVMLGILLIIGGYMVHRDGTTRSVPGRSELKTVAGVVQTVTKVDHKAKDGRHIRTSYELDVRTDSGGYAKLELPSSKIDDRIAAMLRGMPITALPRGTAGRNVWELKAGGTTLIDYETERKAFTQAMADEARYGPFIIIGGFAFMGAGLYWLWRKRASY
jgi:hypothetical protein